MIFAGILLMVGVVAMTGVGFNTALSQVSTTFLTEEERDEYGKDDDGKKLDYNDCPHYDDGIDPSEYDGMSIPALGAITDAVDERILAIEIGVTTGDPEELQEELNCLAAIRAIENEGLAKLSGELSGFIEDLEEISDLYSDQQSVNERFESLEEKYGQ